MKKKYTHFKLESFLCLKLALLVTFVALFFLGFGNFGYAQGSVRSLSGSSTICFGDSVVITTSDTFQANPNFPLVSFVSSAGNSTTLARRTLGNNQIICQPVPNAAGQDDSLIVYLSGGGPGGPWVVERFGITIFSDSSSFAYSGTHFCETLDSIVVDSASFPLSNTYSGFQIREIQSNAWEGWPKINPRTGTVFPGVCTAGQYVIRYTTERCAWEYFDTLEIDQWVDPSFHYPNGPFCSGTALSVSPRHPNSGNFIWEFSDTTVQNPFVSGTGSLDLRNLPPGQFNITRTQNNSCATSHTESIRINAPLNPVFDYGQGPFCTDDPVSPLPVFTSGPFLGGKFTAGNTRTNVPWLDSISGEIDLNLISPGTKTIHYEKTSFYCRFHSSVNLQIDSTASLFFQYPQDTFCITSGDTIFPDSNSYFPPNSIFRVIDGPSGGFGLSFGDFRPDSLVPAKYVIRVDAQNGCWSPAFDTIFIEPTPNAYFDYGQYSYCKNGNRSVIRETAGNRSPGRFFCQDTNLIINDSTGTIDLQNSPPGTYFIQYQTFGNCSETHLDSIRIDSIPSFFMQLDSGDLGWNGHLCASLDSSVLNWMHFDTLECADSGLVFDPIRGVVYPNQSEPGEYTLFVDAIAGSCSDFVELKIEIDPEWNGAFFYDDSLAESAVGPGYFCENDARISPVWANNNPISSGSWAYQSFSGSDTLDLDYLGRINLENSAPGIYKVLFLDSSSACTVSLSDTVEIRPAESAWFDYGFERICQFSGTQYPDSLSSFPTQSWYLIPFENSDTTLAFPGNPQTGSLDLSSIQDGPYTMVREVGTFCRAQHQANLVVINAEKPILSLNPSGGSFVCHDQEVELSVARETNRPANYFFTAQGSNGTVFSGTSFAGSFYPKMPDPGDYRIEVVMEIEDCRTRDSLIVSVLPKPQITLDQAVFAQSEADAWTPGVLSLTDSLSVFWWLNLENVVDKTGGDSLRINIPGEYRELTSFLPELIENHHPGQITLNMVPVSRGCRGDSTSYIYTIFPKNHNLFIPEIVTPNGDGLNDDWEIHGTDEVSLENYSIELFNREGGRVFYCASLAPGPPREALDNILRQLPDGVYSWQLWQNPSASPTGQKQRLDSGGLLITRKSF